MQPISRVTSIWNDAHAADDYLTGVSLHSHTSASEESLSFVRMFLDILPGAGPLFAHYEKRCLERHGIRLDFDRAHWRPPLLPRMAFDLEQKQIRDLGLKPLVSITDHDTIEAPQLLRTVASSRHIPMSVEWSARFGSTEFHLGIHNLPSADAPYWMQRMAKYTRTPNDAELLSMVRELDAMPGVLIVFNHPMWDLYKVGRSTHVGEVVRFLASVKQHVHALELNGLRHPRENRETVDLARSTGHLLISGGDRHGLEPNANINLTQAKSYREFVEEIRVERRSHVLFMMQYRQSWQQRMLQSTLNAVSDFPEFIDGWQRWDERAFHPDAAGNMRPLRELWVDGEAPWPLRAAIEFVRMGRSQAFSRSFGFAFSAGSNQMQGLETL